MRDLDLLGLGQHEDAGRGGVDAALGLGDRHPLHAVHAALELQPRPGAVAGLDGAPRLDRDRDVLVAAEVGLVAVEHLGPPAATLGVAQVHPQQVAGEQRRLLAALARLDLEDHVPVVVGVARHQQHPQVVSERLLAAGESHRLGGEGLVLRGELLGGAEVVAGPAASRR